jgi:hypothetical protein
MKLRCLDGTEVKIDIKPSDYSGTSRSEIQRQIGARLKELYPRQVILEEFRIPKTRMSLDFFIPRLGLAYEVQGRQHDEFVAHFHGTIDGLHAQKKRDKHKQEWCDLNNILLVEVRKLEDL